MRSLIKAQEEQHQLNAAMLQSLTDLQRKIDSGRGTTRPEGSKSSTRRRRRTSSGTSDSEESSGDSSSSSHKRKRKRKRHHRDRTRDEVQQGQKAVRAVLGEGEGLLAGHLILKNPAGIQALLLIREKKKKHHRNRSRDELKKAKPPTFDSEVKIGQEAEAWLLGIKKYFQVHDYSGNMKARVAIFNLNGRASIWWEHFKQVKRISERRLKWKQFKKYSSRNTSLTSIMMTRLRSCMS